MQKILSIDISANPAQIAIFEIDKNNINLLEFHRMAHSAIYKNNTPNFNIDDKIEDILPVENLNKKILSAQKISKHSTTEIKPFASLTQVMKNTNNTWTSSILIIPSENTYNIQLKLPFKTKKLIDKIIKQAIQKKLPFNLNEFHINYQILKTENTTSIVNACLIQKELLKTVLYECKKADVSPLIITTPQAILNGFRYLRPDYFTHNTMIGFKRGDNFYLQYKDKENNYKETAFDLHSSYSFNQNQDVENILLEKIKLFIKATENKNDIEIEDIVLINSNLDSKKSSAALNKKINCLDLGHFLQNPENSTPLNAIASLFAQDNSEVKTFSNFRGGEFKYFPRLSNLFKELKKVFPYFLVAFFITLLSLIGNYTFRETSITKTNNKIASLLSSSLPTIEFDKGSENSSLLKEINKLEEELESLGSPSKINPIDTYLEITKIIAEVSVNSEVILSKLNITSNKAEFKGSVPNYKTIEKITGILNTKKNIFCDVKANNSKGNFGSQTREVSYDIRLCE